MMLYVRGLTFWVHWPSDFAYCPSRMGPKLTMKRRLAETIGSKVANVDLLTLSSEACQSEPQSKRPSQKVVDLDFWPYLVQQSEQ